ncbi:MAG: saccharopine dehydrogenase NADP-binding domain-containing protein [Terriglobales bacterium]
MSKQIRDSERPSAATTRVVGVYGASGHTGRFVVSELERRGWKIVAAGRDSDKLQTLAANHSDLEIRVASIDDPKSLDKACAGAVAVINCAGPFLDTAAPLISAALRARIHYLDVTAEQAATVAAFEQFSEPARDARVVVLPSMAFYGGLGDLLATATMDDWSQADAIRIAVGLDSWKPTQGTRRTGERNTYRRCVFSSGKLEFLADPAPKAKWHFPPPFGTQEVVALPLAETIVISRHLRVPEVQAYMNLTPLEDLDDPNTPEPTAVDETGRSAQKFVMDVIVRRGEVSRRTTARGQDIYAITAPLVVEALERISSSRKKVSGTVAPGEIFDARDFLKALAQSHLEVDFLGSTAPAAEHTK